MAAEDFIITRKRKKYKFAKFEEAGNCFEAEEWLALSVRPEVVTVELGAGTGLFLVELARRSPERQFVALDVKADRLYQGAREARTAGVKNVFFVRAHARQIGELFAPGSVDDLWLTFSDPFPKKRQAKHRLTHPIFLASFKKLISAEGKLRFKTDNLGLFHWSLEQLVSERMHLSQLTFDLHESDFSDDFKIMTTFEKRFVAEGLPIYALTASLAS